MRILAIRGSNLTSLEGPFELDLETGPLGDAGIFAISGPTGAGKSTLLDALCVALYNKTPRLGGQGGVEVGRADGAMRGLPANDPRNLLRDGAAEGYAEVDFVGRDARRWRARWTVRRARGRADGKLQAVELLLQEIDGARVGGTLTETLAAIERELGLDFDQFRRAALLAQGDFAAFLKAKAAERAGLLEQMTGTKIYGKISMLAWARNAAEQRSLEDLEGKLADARPADTEARAAAEATEAEAAAARGRAADALARGRAALAWHRTAEALAADLQRAQGERAGAEARRAELAPLRDELRDAEAVEPARTAVEALDAAARREEDAARSAAEKAETASSLEGSSTQAQATATTADGACAEAEAARVAAGPALQAARAADVRLAEAERRAKEAAAAAHTANRASTEAAAARAAEEGRLAAEDARLAELDEWLVRHDATATVAAAWGELQVHLGVLAAETTRRAAAEAEAPALAAAAHAAAQAEARAQEAHAARLAEAGAARGAEQAAAAALAARAGAEDVSLRRARLLAQRDGLARCGELLVAWRRLGAERDAEARGVVAAEAAAAEAEGHRGRAAAALVERTTRLSEARDGLRRAQAALDLTGHRAALVEGAECPLCGATEHPWRGGSPLADLVDDAHGRVAALDAEVAELVKTEAAARTRAAAETAEAGRARARVADREAARAATATAWTAARVSPAPDAPPDIDADTLAAALAAAEADAAEALAALGREEREDARLQKAHVEAIGAAQAASTRATDAERAAAVATRAREDADRAAAEATLRAASAAAAVTAALAAAAPPFGASAKWRASASADPVAFRDACAREVTEYGARRDARVDVAAGRARVELALAASTTAASERAAAAAIAEEAAAAALAALRSAEDARAVLLGGAPADPFEAALLRAVDGARQRAAESRAAAQRAAEAATGARAAALAAADEQARRVRELADARAAIEALLLDLAIDEAALRARLSRDRHWRDDARRRITDADTAVVEAVTRETERARAADAHTVNDPPAEGRPAVEAALPAAEAAQRAADDAWTAARAVLLEDDARRARSASLLPAIEAQRVVTERWRTISRLIGSASGNVFRQFAQGLTLNLLLVEANVQLAALNPRYQLQRVPNVEMELQVVDLHMAEQVRPLTSLSGGETFLVSLALALGLASLAATRTRVESIFIDEGFGTLDADTLDVALSTLEGLRAEGRTVGVISHVGGLAERLGAWVSVRKVGPGRSRVEIHTG